MSSISPVQQSLPFTPPAPAAPPRRVEADRDDQVKAADKKEEKDAPAPAKQSDTVQAAKAPGTGTVVDVRA